MIYEMLIGILVYAVLFIVTVQSSRRKVLALQERLEKVRALQELQQAQSRQNIEQNETKIRELETLLQKLGDENSLLRLELEEKKATLDYNNKVAIIENEKRLQAETVIFSSDIYRHIQDCLNGGRSLNHQDWSALSELVNSVYTGFTEKLYSLYRMTEQDYHVSLLIKVRIQPKDIALLTAHQRICIAHTVVLALMQVALGKRPHPEEAYQRKDGEDQQLQIESQTTDGSKSCEERTDGEADDKEITRRKFQNQTDDGYHRPHLP